MYFSIDSHPGEKCFSPDWAVCVVLQLPHPVWVPFNFSLLLPFWVPLVGCGAGSRGFASPRAPHAEACPWQLRVTSYQSAATLPSMQQAAPFGQLRRRAGYRSFYSLVFWEVLVWAGCVWPTTGCPRGAPGTSYWPLITHGTRTERVLPMLRGYLRPSGGSSLLFTWSRLLHDIRTMFSFSTWFLGGDPCLLFALFLENLGALEWLSTRSLFTVRVP